MDGARVWVGIIAIAVGVVLIAFRRPIAHANAKALRERFGRVAGGSATKSTPGNAMFVGFVCIAIGAFNVLVAL
ncbi:hypothetical protein [Agromyces sp. LHK192]|uniref:hypothetical protein n=1 Tax=Agromyces sp. LHK192 TaxID=2498704 RepID=UPI000FD7F579|nr:hypothetical protein [Agromyces sp. LHK192]